jgi:hypothetical protein
LEEYIGKCNINYDGVVSLRIECVFTNTFAFHNLANNTIYIPSNYDWVENGINDQVAYGTLDVMKKYNSINPVQLLQNKLSIPHPESLTYANLKFHKLQIERVNIQYHLDR